MAESKPTKNTSDEVQPSRLGFVTPGRLFGPMIPFGSAFAVNPFALMREFTKEMDRTFPPLPNEGLTFPAWTPALEVSETNGNFVVTAELPGIKTEDVRVEVEDQTLTIQGERKQEKEEEKQGIRRSERAYGRFYRSILLPDGANTDQIKAEMKNGVLEIKVPLAESKQTSREIPVTEAGGGMQQEKTAAA